MRIKYVHSYQEQSYRISNIEKMALKKKKAVAFDQSFYKQLTHNYNGVEFGKILEDADTCGNCYFYALLLSRAMPGSSLKIGRLNNLSISVLDMYYNEFGHSWVEFDSKVYDTTAKMIFDKDFYYKYFGAEAVHSFEHNDLCNDVKFFALGLSSVRYRSQLLYKYKTYTREIYNSNIEECNRVIDNFPYNIEYDIKKVNVEELFKH